MTTRRCRQHKPEEIVRKLLCWDFELDHMTSGNMLKWLTIVDEFTRECLALKVDRVIASQVAIDILA